MFSLKSNSLFQWHDNQDRGDELSLTYNFKCIDNVYIRVFFKPMVLLAEGFQPQRVFIVACNTALTKLGSLFRKIVKSGIEVDFLW